MTEVSVFDVIGPIMVGPSSSHTAGAVRLGLMARALIGGTPQRVEIGLHGSFAQTGRGHGTDRGVVGGLLGFATDDDRIRASFAIAEAQGMEFTLAEVDLGGEAHPNSVAFDLWREETHLHCTGASVGGGMIRMTEVQGYPASFSGMFETLVVVAEDRPGTINAVTSWFLMYNLNIATFKVERQGRGDEAIMILESDDTIPSHLPEAISDFPWVHWVRYIPRLMS